MLREGHFIYPHPISLHQQLGHPSSYFLLPRKKDSRFSGLSSSRLSLVSRAVRVFWDSKSGWGGTSPFCGIFFARRLSESLSFYFSRSFFRSSINISNLRSLIQAETSFLPTNYIQERGGTKRIVMYGEERGNEGVKEKIKKGRTRVGAC